MKLRLGLLVVLALAAFPSSGGADVSGAGPDETASQAFGPLQAGVAYSGAFVSASDSDYLSFVVVQAGETLEFTVKNTTHVCQDPYDAGCPVYATLMDSTGQNQVGGNNSGAGTIATAGDTETFAWTFAQPGTYYVLMESDGDLPAGSPAYALELAGGAGTGSSAGPGAPGSGSSGGTGGPGVSGASNTGPGSGSSGGSGGPGGSGAVNTGLPFVRSLKVLREQGGSDVVVTLDLGRTAPWVRAALFLAHGRGRVRPVVGRTFDHVRPGRRRLVLRIPPTERRKLAREQRPSLILTISVATASGSPKRYVRTVTFPECRLNRRASPDQACIRRSAVRRGAVRAVAEAYLGAETVLGRRLGEVGA